MKKKKINFFSRIIRAVTKFDDYIFFVEEKFSVSIAYILKLILLMSVIMGVIISYLYVQQIQNTYSKIVEYIPDFQFENYELIATEQIENVDTENDMYLCVDTSELSEEALNQYKEKISDYSMGIVFLKDKLIYKSNEIIEQKYQDIMNSAGIEDNITFNKQEAINYIDENIMNFSLYVVVFIMISLTFFIATVISVVSDVLLLWLLGIITSRIARLRLKYTDLLTIAIYSLTLPLLLLTIYNIVITYTSFRIDFFNVIYISIAYIYVIAAILMIKSDMIKQNIEVTAIIDAQNEIKEENNQDEEDNEKEEKKEKPKDEDKQKDNDDDGLNVNDNEPDGSEI